MSRRRSRSSGRLEQGWRFYREKGVTFPEKFRSARKNGWCHSSSRSKPCSFPRRTHSTQRRDCGYISSGAKSFTLGQSVGMGYVSHRAPVTKELIDSSRSEIEIGGRLYEAGASLRAFFDPNGERLGR
ncbi:MULTISPECIES: glycine cleavage T C-terminal barrel domain-containing protein [Mesorhizobium]|uniref:glycine cleavage T C-terminal barrel domain-containing protein n=1 Tax=Mesorhizobium TaxID=68287 RepID=UPI000B877EAE|nr:MULTISPECIES: glycine cleavage T C-terminal barrel domain-containing protein [Mesorhizobium]MCF6098474.1 hypothetical protein [Mesorhizobium muleiense]